MTKTLPNIASPHIGIHREIGQQVLASLEDGHTHRQTQLNYIYRYNLAPYKRLKIQLQIFVIHNLVFLVWLGISRNP